jgi:hypothetical protein
MAWAKWFLDTFHISPTHFGVRFPFALWGILTVAAAFFCGRSAGGGRLGVVVSLLVAVNPFLIQVATEAYHYSSLVLGAFVLLWVGLDVSAWALLGRRLGRYVYGLNAVGFFLVAYSQPSGWTYALLIGSVVLGCGAVASWRQRRMVPALWIPGLTYVVVGMPLLFVNWGVPQILRILNPTQVAALAVTFGAPESTFGALWGIWTKWSWGATWWGGALLGLIGFAGAWHAIRKIREDARLVGLVGVVILGVVALALASKASGAHPDARYLAGYLPAFFLTLGFGVLASCDFVASRIRYAAAGPLLSVAAAVGLAGLQIEPAWWCTQLKGKPPPYKEAQTWFNTHPPSGTLVLVDRWFEPWCELKTYSSTNVFFTFTVPNEPVDVFLKVNWRKTAQEFFEKYPDAAYLEVSKPYWDHPMVGPWEWPRKHFKHHVEFRNDAAIRLTERGLCLRMGKDSLRYKGSAVMECFFNTRQDVVETSRAEGRPFVVFYTSGWGYTKLWRQIPGDFRDWRVLQGTGKMEVYDLGKTSTNVTLTIRAVALNGGKHVRCSNGSEFRFPQGQIAEWKIEKVPLAPGKNSLTLTDTGGSQQAVLLVEDVRVE